MLLLALVACGHEEPDAVSSPALVVHQGTVAGEPHDVWEAAIVGRLTSDGACLRIGPDGPVPIWHPGTSFHAGPSGWEVRVGDAVIGREGELFYAGGGHASSAQTAVGVNECPGPYFAIGEVDPVGIQALQIAKMRGRWDGLPPNEERPAWLTE